MADILSTTQYLFKYLFQVDKMHTRHAQKIMRVNEKRVVIADTQINLVSSLHHGFYHFQKNTSVPERPMLGTIQTSSG